MERLTGDTPDIYDWTDFEFYDMVWHWHGGYDKPSSKLGRWLGVSHACGRTLNYFVLDDIRKLIMHNIVQHQTATELQKTEVQQIIRDYHTRMHAAIGATVVVESDDEIIRLQQ